MNIRTMETFLTRMIIYFFSFVSVVLFSNFSLCLFLGLLFFLTMLNENKDDFYDFSIVGMSTILSLADLFAVYMSVFEYLNPNIFGIPLWTIPFRAIQICFIIDVYVSSHSISNVVNTINNNYKV